MSEEKLKATIKEALRFLRIAEPALERLHTDNYAKYGSRETGACRRASMDLTRALAELRKP